MERLYCPKDQDKCVLREMKRMYRQGYRTARAGTMARRLHINSVQALGAMLRVIKHFQRWVKNPTGKILLVPV